MYDVRCTMYESLKIAASAFIGQAYIVHRTPYIKHKKVSD